MKKKIKQPNQQEKWEEDKKFFNQLAEKLEELFPKHRCQERSQALVLNAFANIFHSQLLAQQNRKLNAYCEKVLEQEREMVIKEIEKMDLKYTCDCRDEILNQLRDRKE